MSKYFIFLVILASSYAKSHAKGDAQGSVKSDVKEEGRFAASLNEQDNARTHNAPWKHPFSFFNNQYQQNRPHGFSGFLPGILSHGGSGFPGGYLSYLHNKKPSFLRPPPVAPPAHPAHPVQPVRPVKPVQPIPFKPTFSIMPMPLIPFYHEPVFTKPSVPLVPIHPPIVPEPMFPMKPTLPVFDKPALLVSQKIIHKPVFTEKVEIVRRPVLSEVVQTIHKPIIQEELQVVKIPTYVQHVVEKPLVTKPVSDEHVGSPIYLPAQQYTIHEEPLPMRPVTTGVYQIPHQIFAGHGPAGYGLGHGIGSVIKPGFSIGSSHGGVGTSYGVPSYNFGSSYGGLGSGYGGVGSSYGTSRHKFGIKFGGMGPNYGTPSYNFGSGYGGMGSSYGTPSYNVGSGYGGTGSIYGTPGYNFGSGYGGMGSSYGTPSTNFGSGYGGMYNYGFGGVGPNYVPMGGIGSSNYGASSGGYGVESEGVGPMFLEPAPSCKQNDNCKPTRNEELSQDEEQPPYSPQMWYDGFQLQPQRPRSMIEDYGVEGEYPYFVPMSDPSDDAQISKVREFLDDPSTRMELMNMLQDYLGKNITPTQMLDGDKPTGKSSNEDTNTEDSAADSADEVKAVNMVLESMKNLKPSSLKKLEDAVKELQAVVAKKVDSKMDVIPVKSTESTPAAISTAQS